MAGGDREPRRLDLAVLAAGRRCRCSRPPFLGSTLLLFANAFSAYATAAALVSQGSPIVPLQIRGALTSEVVLGQQNLGKAMALGMIVVVAVVMWLYALLQRRTSRWLG